MKLYEQREKINNFARVCGGGGSFRKRLNATIPYSTYLVIYQ